MSAECVCCGKPMADQAYACRRCGIDQPKAYLAEIADMLPAARDIAQRQSVHGDGSTSGKPGSSLPLSLTATARLDAVQNELVGQVRIIAEERGIAVPLVAPLRGPACQSCGHPSCAEIRPRAPLDVILAAVRWLPGHLEWVRHREDADEALRTIRACARVVAGIARGPADHRYLGPCGATVTWDDDGAEVERGEPCDGDVYVPDGRDTGTCRDCGARWMSATRREWLDGKVREHNYRASEIAAAYDGLKANTIRKWAERGHIIAHGHDGEGRPLFNLGEVLDWAAADTGRRETERAKRARRAAARAAESENAA